MEKIDTIRGCVHFPVAGIENISYISSCINGYFLINPEITPFTNLNHKIKKKPEYQIIYSSFPNRFLNTINFCHNMTKTDYWELSTIDLY